MLSLPMYLTEEAMRLAGEALSRRRRGRRDG
jgi:hypothetical protein